MPAAERVPAQASVRDALSIILTAGGEAVAVVDSENRIQGLLTLGLIEQLLSQESARSADRADALTASAAAAQTPEAAS
jgi:hypothetical protein